MTLIYIAAALAVFAIALLIYDWNAYIPNWLRDIGVVCICCAPVIFVAGCIQILLRHTP